MINVLLYKGKSVVDVVNLQAGPTEFIYQGGEKLRNEYEDLCKYELADGRIKLMYLIANQSRTDGKFLNQTGNYFLLFDENASHRLQLFLCLVR